MTTSLTRLIQENSGETDSVLLVADESCKESQIDDLPLNVEVLTNRWGLYQSACERGLIAHFNDFDFSVLSSPKSTVYYRISKEKAVAHHIIKSTFTILQAGGRLIMWGEKKTGIKTYTKKAGLLFSSSSQPKKSGNEYLAVLEKSERSDSETVKQQWVDAELDDNDYPQLRRVIQFDPVTLYSKPGLFGWDKLDRGSSLLIEHLDDFIAGFKKFPDNLLDLGCGYGLLSAAAAYRGVAQVVAVDNCAAAIVACEKNMAGPCQTLYELEKAKAKGVSSASSVFSGRVIAADCRARYAGNLACEVDRQFDAVLCNPPFHQGFDTEKELTESFVKVAAQQLHRSGRALFVTNRFINLTEVARDYFAGVAILAENREFRLTLLQDVRV